MAKIKMIPNQELLWPLCTKAISTQALGVSRQVTFEHGRSKQGPRDHNPREQGPKSKCDDYDGVT